MCGFPLGSSASSHSSKTCDIGELVTVNCLLSADICSAPPVTLKENRSIDPIHPQIVHRCSFRQCRFLLSPSSKLLLPQFPAQRRKSNDPCQSASTPVVLQTTGPKRAFLFWNEPSVIMHYSSSIVWSLESLNCLAMLLHNCIYSSFMAWSSLSCLLFYSRHIFSIKLLSIILLGSHLVSFYCFISVLIFL